jgi:hypothetical protein
MRRSFRIVARKITQLETLDAGFRADGHETLQHIRGGFSFAFDVKFLALYVLVSPYLFPTEVTVLETATVCLVRIHPQSRCVHLKTGSGFIVKSL